jgi:hypothetical protein
MDWLRENFFWLAVAAAFFWMHLKMHGGHGHGSHGHHGGDGSQRTPGHDTDATKGSRDTHAEH